MKINPIKIAITVFYLSLTACSTKEETLTPASTSGNLAANSWSFDGVVSKLSAYGFGWASTDFSPRAGWTDFTTNAKETRAIEISVLTKPLPAGKYTVELYTDIHLNKNRTVKLTGNKVGIIAQIGSVEYQSIAEAGSVDVSVSGGKTKLTFKDISLKESNGIKVIKAAGNLEYNN